mmetsp:Transcript_14486/g.29635  ORF Transcript_14486/g.29635 Transcript_14486/m.29635 type:complete len:81 (-) Transcript_14486:1061-1303(-)
MAEMTSCSDSQNEATPTVGQRYKFLVIDGGENIQDSRFSDLKCTWIIPVCIYSDAGDCDRTRERSTVSRDDAQNSDKSLA